MLRHLPTHTICFQAGSKSGEINFFSASLFLRVCIQAWVYWTCSVNEFSVQDLGCHKKKNKKNPHMLENLHILQNLRMLENPRVLKNPCMLENPRMLENLHMCINVWDG